MSRKLTDTRTRAHGWPSVLIYTLGVGALIFAWRAVVATTTLMSAGDYSCALTSILAALSWLVGFAGVKHNGRKMRYIAFVAWTINLAMPLIGLFANFHYTNPWFEAGATYYYLPTIGAIAALAWLMWSRPAAMAARQLEEAKK
ncbi:hypothetical protein [Trueperella pyogenes]|uniref:hypothetical protein n=1 Tax=Trueperella pyogenes TaxID=1661 RepID=UPI00057F0A9B|nr:hypothetical protein [Trueperella pyogenes]AJC70596.1 hypothetical protein X956_06275 [Trueperella pyogenes TP8]ALD74347.1 hypothetical protein AN946_08605 [Trueperella pyogenes]WHU56829.1 hypothetical protein QEV10_08825 [Trueperella pyogenes]